MPGCPVVRRSRSATMLGLLTLLLCAVARKVTLRLASNSQRRVPFHCRAGRTLTQVQYRSNKGVFCFPRVFFGAIRVPLSR
jgi:hypothetical protein